MSDTPTHELPLAPERAVIATRLPLPLDAVQAADVVSGSPQAGALIVAGIGGVDVGVWEITPGVVTDTEAEEVFVVLSGNATIEFLDSGAVLVLGPGSVAKLPEGASTRWHVTTTLRKVYLSLSE